jgi:Asp/Glu/hydantoin racemase
VNVRIKAITPIRVGGAELARRQARYEALSPPGVEVELVDLPDWPGVPKRLDSARDIRASEGFVIEEASRTDPTRHDAVLPDCVLDPGLDRLERGGPVPAFGILKLSAGFLVSLGHRFAAFTRNRPIGEELRERLETYGFLPHFDRVEVLDLAFEDIADDEGWNAALREAGERFSGSRTTAVINGCSAVEVRPASGNSIAVVDPTGLALSSLGLAVSEGLASGAGSTRGSLTATEGRGAGLGG